MDPKIVPKLVLPEERIAISMPTFGVLSVVNIISNGAKKIREAIKVGKVNTDREFSDKIANRLPKHEIKLRDRYNQTLLQI